MFRKREKSWLDEELERERKQSQGETTLGSKITDILGRIRRKPIYETKGLTSPILQAAVYDRAFEDLERAAREYGATTVEVASEVHTLYSDNDVLCTIIR